MSKHAPDPAGLFWYAFLVPAQKEYTAAHILTRRGAVTYVPTHTRFRRRNRYAKRKEEFAFPVAPRYVFAGFRHPPEWYWLFQLPLILAVVGINGTPKSMLNNKLAEFMGATPNGKLKLAEGERSIEVEGRRPLRAPKEQRHMRTHREFKAGDEVDIVDGAYRDRKVIVREITGHMAKILMPLFGAEREVEVPLENLERTS